MFSGALAFYNYFLKPHESQSHGSVAVPDGQEGVAYCAVNPEDGVDIGYTVCAYHGEETDLDWIASPFIANGSSDCCLCGMCGGEVLGPGVTAILDPSPPNSNNFSVLACLPNKHNFMIWLRHNDNTTINQLEATWGVRGGLRMEFQTMGRIRSLSRFMFGVALLIWMTSTLLLS